MKKTILLFWLLLTSGLGTTNLASGSDLPSNFDCTKDLAKLYYEHPFDAYGLDRTEPHFPGLGHAGEHWYNLFHQCKKKHDPIELFKSNIKYARWKGTRLKENPFHHDFYSVNNAMQTYQKENATRIRWFKTVKNLNTMAARYLMEANGFSTDFNEIETNIGGIDIAYAN